MSCDVDESIIFASFPFAAICKNNPREQMTIIMITATMANSSEDCPLSVRRFLHMFDFLEDRLIVR